MSEDHKVQYFYPRKNLAKLLREVSTFIEESGVEVISVSLDAGYDQERQAATFAAVVVFIGGSDA
jgi:hypothetical protein